MKLTQFLNESQVKKEISPTLLKRFINGLGAKRVEGYGGVGFEIETQHGTLNVTVYLPVKARLKRDRKTGWIAARFEDPKAGCDSIGCSQPSGKWNFMTGSAGWDATVDDFMLRVSNIGLKVNQSAAEGPKKKAPTPAAVTKAISSAIVKNTKKYMVRDKVSGKGSLHTRKSGLGFPASKLAERMLHDVQFALRTQFEMEEVDKTKSKKGDGVEYGNETHVVSYVITKEPYFPNDLSKGYMFNVTIELRLVGAPRAKELNWPK